MTCDQIRIDAQLLSGSKIETATSFIWCKDAIAYIVRHYPLSAPIKTVEVDIAEDGGTYQITDELVRLEKVTGGESTRPLTQTSFDCDEVGLIKFYNAGHYYINYRYVPAMPDSTSSQILIPERYSEPIKYYLAAKIRGRVFGQADNDCQSYEALYLNYLENADATMKQTNKRHRRMPARF